jgi:hypothetical protein
MRSGWTRCIISFVGRLNLGNPTGLDTSIETNRKKEHKDRNCPMRIHFSVIFSSLDNKKRAGAQGPTDHRSDSSDRQGNPNPLFHGSIIRLHLLFFCFQMSLGLIRLSRLSIYYPINDDICLLHVVGCGSPSGIGECSARMNYHWTCSESSHRGRVRGPRGIRQGCSVMQKLGLLNEVRLDVFHYVNLRIP